MILEAVEKRFGATRAPHAIEHLSDNGSSDTARKQTPCSSGRLVHLVIGQQNAAPPCRRRGFNEQNAAIP
jgi:hypothetical protein